MTIMRDTDISLEVHESNAEGPTTWYPKIPRAAAIVLLDHKIARIKRQLAQVEKMRSLVADETCGGWFKPGTAGTGSKEQP